MAKKDITITRDVNHICSRSQKKVEHEKALEVLAKAKQIPRKVVFLKQGESKFSRELTKQEDTSDMLSSKDAAVYLCLSYNAFTRRQSKSKIPCVKKNGNKKYFKISDLDHFQAKYTNQ
ncbi:hypothetical protein [Chryseobacterium indologenes]|uniref:Helix-turn-helix domain-containing protein n=1 Tax=Chryseobacterium indologenes TaxID=253 RepID=A0A0N0IW38_CHRID|nr:hypothetical protein [Chryseobacterium indologenes]KPE51002.1 hypothetical protein AOB46_12500 [Chryseobacterium indologenes]